MSLTPDDVREITFRKPTIGKRGYDAEEVDAFLAEAGVELGRLLEENLRLRQAERGLSSFGSAPASSVQHEINEIRAQIQHLRMQQVAAERDLRAGQAQMASSRTGAVHDEQGGQVLSMAQRTAEQHLSDARREADSLVSEARVDAEQMVNDAEIKARSLIERAQRRHEATLDEIEEARSALRAQIKSVAAFGADYHGALRADVERRMPELGNLLVPELPR